MNEHNTLKDVLKPPFTHDSVGFVYHDGGNRLLDIPGHVFDDEEPESPPLARVRGWGFFQYFKNGEDLQDAFMDFVKDALNEKSARDFEEPKRWIKVEDSWGEYHYECPYCEDAFYFEEGGPRENNFNFCHNCGKRLLMPEEEKC